MVDAQEPLQVRSKSADRGRWLWTALAALALIALVSGFAWYKLHYVPRMAAARIAAMPQPQVTVSTVPSETRAWRTELTAVATLEAAQGVEIAAQVDGIVTAIHFESGAEVAAGAILLQLDDQVLRAQLQEAQAELGNARRDFTRIEDLARRNTVSKASLDTARARRDGAQAAVARIAALLEQRTVRAPFAGRTGVRRVQPGQYLEAGTAIVSLQNLRPMHANFAVPEQALAQLGVGQEVALLRSPTDRIRGRITAIDSKVDPATRTVLAQATFANDDQRLVPGEYADLVVFGSDAPTPLTVIPETAVQYSLAGDTVFVVVTAPDGSLRAEQRVVKLGARRDGLIAIESGVRSGEQVVAIGQFKLRNGAPVRIDNSALPTAPTLRDKH